LLSTGVEVALPHHAALGPHFPTLHARTAIKSTPPAHNILRPLSIKHRTITAVPGAAELERPAGAAVSGTPTAFDPIVGSAAARAAYGVDGTGMAVAVIDTGVDYNNPALGGGLGPESKVIAGYNFATNSPDPLATASQHGTAVAGLIGSGDPSHLGVSPGVKIVALRVVGDNNSADLSNIARALQWVIDHHTAYNITVVNMSLSDGGNYAQNWFASDGGVGQQITDLIDQLTSLNIPVVSATGNSFTGQQGEGFTAVVSGVISVTATDTSDHLLPDAQRLGPAIGMGTMTDLAAPGAEMLAPSGDSGTSSVQGTSFAAPLVSGAVVLLQQIYQARFGTLPTVDQVTGWLEQGSDPIVDPVTGLTIGRLDIPKAAGLIPSPVPASAPPSVTVIPPPIQPSSGSSSSAPVTQVSYTPVIPSPPTSAPTPVVAAETLSVPAQPANPSQPPTTITLPQGVQVFVNGKAIDSSNPSDSNLLPTLAQSNFTSLLLGMSAWAVGTTGSQAGSAPVSQVRIWSAPALSAAGITTGTAYPTGILAVRMVRPHHRFR
jgi:type VI secretion system secreted protein VgrG